MGIFAQVFFLIALSVSSVAHAKKIVISDFDGTIVPLSFSNYVLFRLNYPAFGVQPSIQGKPEIYIPRDLFETFDQANLFAHGENILGNTNFELTLPSGEKFVPGFYYLKRENAESYRFYRCAAEGTECKTTYVEQDLDRSLASKNRKLLEGFFYPYMEFFLSKPETAEQFGTLTYREELESFFKALQKKGEIAHSLNPKRNFTLGDEKFVRYGKGDEKGVRKVRALKEKIKQVGDTALDPGEKYHVFMYAEDEPDLIDHVKALFLDVAGRKTTTYPMKLILVHAGKQKDFESSSLPHRFSVATENGFRKATPAEMIAEVADPKTLTDKQSQRLGLHQPAMFCNRLVELPRRVR